MSRLRAEATHDGQMGGDLASPPARGLAGRLRQVRWIGGGSGAGKTTTARRLAERHGLRLYSTDAAMSAHAASAGMRNCPCLRDFVAMSMDERWLNRSPEVMLETFHWFR